MSRFGIWIFLAFASLLCSSTPASVVFIPEPSLYGYIPNYFSGTNSRVEYHVYCDGMIYENLESVELLINDEVVGTKTFPPFEEMETEKATIAAMFDPTHFTDPDLVVKFRARVSGEWYEDSYTRPAKTNAACFQQVIGSPIPHIGQFGQQVMASKLLEMGYGAPSPIFHPYFPNFTSATYWQFSQVASIVGYSGHGGAGSHEVGAGPENIWGLDWISWPQPGHPGPDSWLAHRQPLFALPAPLNETPMINLLYLDACQCLNANGDFSSGALFPHLNAYWNWPWFFFFFKMRIKQCWDSQCLRLQVTQS